MKAKLIKDHDDYHLVNDEQFIIGTTDKSILSCTDKYKLSLKNCQAIELGYNLDELAESYANYMNDEDGTTDIDFKVGFQKALELMGDKKFSEGQMKSLFAKTLESSPNTESHTRMISDTEYRHFLMDEMYNRIIKSLQQTEWDVEIITEPMNLDEIREQGKGFLNSNTKKPKIDADGYLILKRK